MVLYYQTRFSNLIIDPLTQIVSSGSIAPCHLDHLPHLRLLALHRWFRPATMEAVLGKSLRIRGAQKPQPQKAYRRQLVLVVTALEKSIQN